MLIISCNLELYKHLWRCLFVSDCFILQCLWERKCNVPCDGFSITTQEWAAFRISGEFDKKLFCYPFFPVYCGAEDDLHTAIPPHQDPASMQKSKSATFFFPFQKSCCSVSKQNECHLQPQGWWPTTSTTGTVCENVCENMGSELDCLTVFSWMDVLVIPCFSSFYLLFKCSENKTTQKCLSSLHEQEQWCHLKYF